MKNTLKIFMSQGLDKACLVQRFLVRALNLCSGLLVSSLIEISPDKIGMFICMSVKPIISFLENTFFNQSKKLTTISFLNGQPQKIIYIIITFSHLLWQFY